MSAVFAGGATVRAKYVVGADGMHSTVREQAGIAFTGGQYAESFSLADVRLTGGVPGDEVILFFSPAGLVVVAPLPDGTHRIVATVDEAPAEPDVAFVQALPDSRGPEKDRAVVHEIIWGSRFRGHHRVADAYRPGRPP
ncbi:2-polyprenyl-6-methoxyphenol hydroxylase-like FAD-dependent oxidoreductase [Streptosporangium album]|uniref:2-polyprenyl-6-methoxyphenol hydroxylase-like FAD-dependent oxidoreductase n=1 Tax=Streptosporangium album TaxID=47479 RepID=A0A7W7RUA8_9ACTN|nr:2-polyprenyl-6-methoxyphenol hydroxylase-like FAD-dependent oxidoreductase [Streptosporangium album]